PSPAPIAGPGPPRISLPNRNAPPVRRKPGPASVGQKSRRPPVRWERAAAGDSAGTGVGQYGLYVPLSRGPDAGVTGAGGEITAPCLGGTLGALGISLGTSPLGSGATTGPPGT